MTDILGIREYVKIELCKGFKNICITGNIKINTKKNWNLIYILLTMNKI